MVEANATTFEKSAAVRALKEHYERVTKQVHLRDLLQDEERNAALRFNVLDNKLWLDYTHTKIDAQGLQLLKQVAEAQGVAQGLRDMFNGEVVNPTEGRQVWHVKLRT